jgi:hypothetical protein
MDRLSPAHLDEILSLQLAVAWAGEGAGEPARLGWWKSDLVDGEGGADLFARLVPRTAPWASLILVREAARRVDAAAREQSGLGERGLSLFRFGFTVDEHLADRLAFHRQQLHDPAHVLGPDFFVGSDWSTSAFETLLAGFGQPKVEITPAGRLVTAAKAKGLELARILAAALLPLTAKYPLPYVEAGE